MFYKVVKSDDNHNLYFSASGCPHASRNKTRSLDATGLGGRILDSTLVAGRSLDTSALVGRSLETSFSAMNSSSMLKYGASAAVTAAHMRAALPTSIHTTTGNTSHCNSFNNFNNSLKELSIINNHLLTFDTFQGFIWKSMERTNIKIKQRIFKKIKLRDS